MTGQLLFSFLDFDGFGGDYVDISVNSVLRKRIYDSTNKLYTCPIQVGDVVTLQLTDESPISISYLNLTRTDYTTDDEGGDLGIKETSIASGVLFNTFTFTATTVNSAYDFTYKVSNDLVVQYQILTEAFEPIMTENNDYINQQY